MFQIGLKKVLSLKTLTILCRRHALLLTLMVKKLLEHFAEKNCKQQVKKSLELKPESKENAISYMLNGEATIIL